MGNSASVTVNGITLSLADAARIADEVNANAQVKAYREQQAKEAEAKRIKVGDWVYTEYHIFKVFRMSGNGVSCISVESRIGPAFHPSRCTKITDPDEIATLNRIASRMGGVG